MATEIKNVDIVSDNWNLSQLKDMSNEQIIYIIHNGFIEVINELIRETHNRNQKIKVLFYNSILNELCGRLGISNLKEICINFKI